MKKMNGAEVGMYASIGLYGLAAVLYSAGLLPEVPALLLVLLGFVGVCAAAVAAGRNV